MATKRSILERQRLNWRLRLAARRRITIVHGPAACGKTVAIAQYLAGSQTAHATLHVRSEHATVATFARAIARALEPLAPSALALLPIAFTSSRRRTEPWDAVAVWIAEQIPPSTTIVVDQLHRIDEDEAALRFLTRVIDTSAHGVRWILGTRSTAALPIPRWLASGIGDASIDAAACALDSGDVAALAHLMQADHDLADALRIRYDGAIGNVVAGLQGNADPWRVSGASGADLIALAALETIDNELLAHLPPAMASLIAEARSFDEHDVSRAYAIAEAEGGDAVVRGRLRAAAALESAGRIAQALLLYIAAGTVADVERLVNAHGFALMTHDAADIVGAAIAILPLDARRRNALALMLEAMDESFRGRYDVSESWFETASALALDDRQRQHVQAAFAIDLLRRGREDARERLETLAESVGDAADSVLLRASLAVAHAREGRFADAEVETTEALAALEHVTNVGIRATVYQRAAFVALASSDADRAAHYAELAATLATEHGNEELAAVALSVSHVVSYSHKDDHTRSLAVLAEIERFAARLGNAFFRRFALIGSYLIFAERGNHAEVAKLEARLAHEELEASIQHVEEALLPARALRSSWSGDFAGAYHHLAFSLSRQDTAETRALRAAEIAVYAAIAGHETEALDALATANRDYAETGTERSVESVRALLLSTLAFIVLDRFAEARALLDTSADLIARWPRWQSFATLLGALIDGVEPEIEAETFLACFDAMHEDGLGGWAELIAAIPHDRLARVMERL